MNPLRLVQAQSAVMVQVLPEPVEHFKMLLILWLGKLCSGRHKIGCLKNMPMKRINATNFEPICGNFSRLAFNVDFPKQFNDVIWQYRLTIFSKKNANFFAIISFSWTHKSTIQRLNLMGTMRRK
jgi:hypothetical protein